MIHFLLIPRSSCSSPGGSAGRNSPRILRRSGCRTPTFSAASSRPPYLAPTGRHRGTLLAHRRRSPLPATRIWRKPMESKTPSSRASKGLARGAAAPCSRWRSRSCSPACSSTSEWPRRVSRRVGDPDSGNMGGCVITCVAFFISPRGRCGHQYGLGAQCLSCAWDQFLEINDWMQADSDPADC